MSALRQFFPVGMMRWLGIVAIVAISRWLGAASPEQPPVPEVKPKAPTLEQPVWHDPEHRYSRFLVLGGAFHVLVDDLDGDGRIDLAFTSHSGNQIRVFRQAAPRRFEATGPQGIVGFHPNDTIALPGMPKRYLVNAEGEGRLRVLAAQSDARLSLVAERDQLAPLGSAAFVWPDWGRLSLAVAPYSGLSLTLLRDFNPETAEAKAVVTVQTDRDPRPVRLADLNDDGTAELVFPTFWSNKVWAVEYKGFDQDPALRELAAFKDGWPRHVVPLDVDRNGTIDLLVPMSVRERIAVLLNDGKGHFREGPSIPYPARTGVHTLSVGQDRGGRYLLAGGSRALVLYRERQATPGSFESIVLPLLNWPNRLELSDVDKDGWLDAVVADQGPLNSQIIYGPLWDNFGKLAANSSNGAVPD